MFRLSLIVVCLASVTLAYPQSLSKAGEDLSCRDYTFDKCSVQITGLIEQVKTDDVNICQMYCNLIYAGRCKFFVFDKKVNLCSLLDEPVENYESTCLKFAGPKQPNYSDCAKEEGSDPCKPFVDETCLLKGKLLENLEQINSKETCQFACFVLPECKYFLYDSELKDCELFDSETRDCDIIRGPPQPLVDGCFTSTTESPVTSTEPATTTTEEPATTTTEEPETTTEEEQDTTIA